MLIEVDPATVSIQPISALEELLVYPNPVDGALHVSFEAKSTMPLALSVINSMGETVFIIPEVIFCRGSQLYDRSPDVSAGVYALQVVSGNEFWTRKVVVTH
ncbi:MAG: T9SS type A sorting domain-containing protein [Saprospiraceae bacterium]|nr:T9SS type A sorting domain-containing protein [Candidatus Opimibacter skivensis]